MRQLRVDLKEVKSSFEIGCGWSQSWVQADIRGMPSFGQNESSERRPGAVSA